MTFTKQAEFTKKVTDLTDVPSQNMTPSQIKSYFQTPADELKTTVNKLVDDLNGSGWVDTAKLGSKAVTREKVAPGAIGVNEIDPSIINQPTTAIGVQAKLDDHTSQLADIVIINPISIIKYNAKSDGTDQKVAIQNALNAAQVGQSVIVPYGDFTFSDITIPSGVHLVSMGGRLIGGIIRFDKSISQAYNSIITGFWFKQCHFIFNYTAGVSTDWINNVIFDKCFIDGTNLVNAGSTTGDAFYITGKTFDIHFSKTYICNYGGHGINIVGNSLEDLTGTPYLATGVFMTFTDVKIFNVSGSGIRFNGSPLDGGSLHLTNVLLDHCGIGLDIDNNPRATNAGEIIVSGSNVRIELCDQAIRNDGGNIFIDGIWSFGKIPSTGNKVINNISGSMYLSGRLSAGDGATYAVYNADGQNCVVDGLLGGGAFYNIKRPILSEELEGNNTILGLRFKLSAGATAGTINCQMVTTDSKSYGNNLLSSALSADFAANGSSTVGTGLSAIKYQLSGNDYLVITLPVAIGKILGTALYKTNTGLGLTVDCRDQASAYLVINLAKTDGSLLFFDQLASGQYVEFGITLSV